MSKLKLEMDALKVESFRTTAARVGEAGTVRAHGGGEVAEAGPAEEAAITSPLKTNAVPTCFGTCGEYTCALLCTYGCTEGCPSLPTCPSGGPACCA